MARPSQAGLIFMWKELDLRKRETKLDDFTSFRRIEAAKCRQLGQPLTIYTYSCTAMGTVMSLQSIRTFFVELA